MSSFNTSMKKDNFSMKLKAQNIKNAQTETKKLELESRKMEERLRELKVAMGKEKEQREKQGGFWKRGQAGSLNTYAEDVLHKPTQKEPKKRSVKLLRDEKIVLPNRSGEPGTMKHIADSYKEKTKVAKCGQCEERSASVSCVQCSEIFCAGCFSAFHYKGALARHRTVPLKASGPRQCMSPRVSLPDTNRSLDTSTVISNGHQNGVSSSSGINDSMNKSSLLNGKFDEDQSAASFQSALQAWRNGDTGVTSPAKNGVILSTSPKRPVSRVQTPTVKTESSTSTQENKQEPIEIKFNTHSVSYADRLLLKKHRRTDVESFTPRALSSSNTYHLDDEDCNDQEAIEHVDFQSLYDAMVPNNNEPQNGFIYNDTSLSITELDSNLKKKYNDMEYTSQYQVEEVDDFKAWQITESAKQSPTKEHISSQVSEAISIPVKTDNSSLTTKQTSTLMEREDSKLSLKVDKAKPTRPKSRTTGSARPYSSRSRPSSRARSRPGSRIQLEGILTKSPTPALVEVAKMTDKEMTNTSLYRYNSVLDDFFTNSDHDTKPVKSTSSSLIDSKKKDIKVSFTLYQMAPRSWRPESSLKENYPSDTMLPDMSEALLECLEPQSDEKLKSDTLEADVKPVFSKNSRINQAEDIKKSATPSEVKFSPRRRMDDNQSHEIMAHRSNKRTHHERRKRTIEEEYKENFDRQLYTPTNDNRAKELMTPIRLDEISCNTETPQPSRNTPRPLTPQSVSRSNVQKTSDTFKMMDEDEFDDELKTQLVDDNETLDQLEWELASESGRLTADGQISRMSLKSLSNSNSSGCSSVRNSTDQGYDISTRLREDELVDSDNNDDMLTDRQDVLALR